MLLLFLYAITLRVEWAPAHLSSEATQYQQIVLDTMSGFSLDFAAQKICWLLGNGLGILGAVLLFMRSSYGLPAILLSAPLLALAAIFGTPPTAFPDIQGTTAFLLWCLSSAAWGGVTVYAFVERDLLFVRQGAEPGVKSK